MTDDGDTEADDEEEQTQYGGTEDEQPTTDLDEGDEDGGDGDTDE
ncbi:hypothetical protein [Natrinema versiforme]|nr:hypothetical protein [Natrinema versiforme]